jgi:hypothetical protein
LQKGCFESWTEISVQRRNEKKKEAVLKAGKNTRLKKKGKRLF